MNGQCESSRRVNLSAGGTGHRPPSIHGCIKPPRTYNKAKQKVTQAMPKRGSSMLFFFCI